MSTQLPDSKTEFIRLAESATGTGTGPASGQVALVPGADVPVLTLELPEGLRGRAREQVARRQLQDGIGLGEGVEMRPCYGAQGADRWTRALVADGALVESWRAAAGPACRAVLPDYLSLPTAPDLWTVETRGEDVLVRLGPEDGFSADPGMARVMLSRALASDGTPPRALLQLGTPMPGLEDLLREADIPVVRNPDEVAPLGLDTPKVLGHGELGLDLRSDPQAARQRLRRRVLPWRLPLVLVLLMMGLWATAQIVETNRLEAAIEQERRATLALTRAHFVPSGPVLDIRAQVSRSLTARRVEAAAWQGRVSPLGVLGQAADVMARQEVEAEQISYSTADGASVVVRVADFGAVDRLVAALQDAWLDVDLKEARTSEDQPGVRATLSVKTKAGVQE